MKNILKSRFSLIAICIVLGILIGAFALCGCRTNYGLLEGMNVKEGATVEGDASGGGGNAITAAIAKAIDTVNPAGDIMPMPSMIGGSGGSGVEEEEEEKEGGDTVPSTSKEAFQVSRPLAWGDIKNTQSEDVNLTKWVSDAIRYSKGMGTENQLDSFQYNSGPEIPLPEGEMFFFKDTKFQPSCCPSTYTSSMGCACLSKKQLQHLIMRGGNHTIPNNKTSYFNEF